MRLWTLSPAYLDTQGLLAAWREGLLALKVLKGMTRGYRNHPQLNRFREGPSPVPSLIAYLSALVREADRRGYRFDRGRIAANGATEKDFREKGILLPVPLGQIEYEAALLLSKVRERHPERAEALRAELEAGPALNEAFRPIPGDRAEWERPVPEALKVLKTLRFSTPAQENPRGG